MTTHLLKLIWNRKRTNFLIMLEIMIAFIVLCVVMTWAAFDVANYLQPRGFSYERIWSLNFSHPYSRMQDKEKRRELTSTVTTQILRELKSFSEIEQVGFVDNGPYQNNWSVTGLKSQDTGHSIDRIVIAGASEQIPDVLDFNLVAGRWFEPGDGELTIEPIVIDQLFAEEMFEMEDPIGKIVESIWAPEGETPDQYRVIGLLDAYRKMGEIRKAQPAMFHYHDIEKDDVRWSGMFLLKMYPNTPPALEEKIIERMQIIDTQWRFEITPMSTMREDRIRSHIMPKVTNALIIIFMILMVGFGLLGVLWQNVTQRTVEIGLRRALGGAASMIQRQILVELLVVTTIGVLIGLIIFPQLYLLEFEFMGVSESFTIDLYIYVIGVAISVMMVYGLSFIAAWYPSRLATRIHPATALHYE